MVAGDVFVRVPVAARETVVGPAPELHEAHAALEQPPRNQTITAEILGDFLVESVRPLDRLRLPRQVQHLRRGQLQHGRHLVGCDPGVEPAVALARRLMLLVHAVEQGQGVRVVVLADAGAFRRKEVVNGVFGPRPDHRALAGSGEETAAPVGRAVGGEAAGVGQHHEGGQVVGQTAEAVADPRTHAGEARQDEAGGLHERGRAVDVGLGDHRVQEGHVVHAFGQVRQQAAHPLAALAVSLPVPRRLHAGAGALWNSSTLPPGLNGWP